MNYFMRWVSLMKNKPEDSVGHPSLPFTVRVAWRYLSRWWLAFYIIILIKLAYVIMNYHRGN